MDALVRALKQNILATGAIGFVLVAFLGFVVVPGLTSGSGNSKQGTPTPQTVANVVGGSKTEVAPNSQPQTPTVVSIQTTATPANSSQGETEYVVKSGDTLSGIAEKFSTTSASIVAFNGLDGDLIAIGQKLKVPATGSAVQVATAKPKDTPAPIDSAASIPTSEPTNTPIPKPTNTPGVPASTSTPKPTNTPGPPTSTPTPKATNTAVPPTAAPKPSVDYVVKSVHRLSGCENHGMLRDNIIVLDKNGSPLNGVNVVRYTNTGDYAGSAVTGDKGPGMVEFSNEGPGMGGNWHAVIEMPGQTSDTAWNLRTDLGGADMPDAECGGELGSYFKHISYDVIFQKTS